MKKLLLIRLSALGDVVFNIPLANILKKNGFTVHWLTSEKGFDIVNNNPCVDKTILAPVEKWKKEKNFIKNFLEYLKIIKDIRKENYDIVIDTQLILKSFIWTKFSNGKRRIVAKSAREGAIFGGNEVIEPLFNDFKLHAVYNYFKFAKYLGLDTSEIKMTLPPTKKEAIEKVDRLLSETDKNKLNLILAPATTWENKHWNKDYWKKLIELIDYEKFNLIFIGTNKDKNLISYIGGDNFINLAGKTNLGELIEVLKRGDILISLDSGSTHLGWATGKPKIISIFTATPKERYAPIGINHIALGGNLPCQPCHKKKCPLSDSKKINNCTNFPKADEVLDALNELERSFNWT